MDQELPTGPMQALLNEMWSLLNDHAMQQNLFGRDIARRAFTSEKTVSLFRTNIRNMQRGIPLPLPPWSSVIALAWAARPTPITWEYSQRLERLTWLYKQAHDAQPREYGTAGNLRATGKQTEEVVSPSIPALQRIRA